MRWYFHIVRGVCVLGVALCATATAQEGIARISEFTGDVAIQRGETVLVPMHVGKVIRNGQLADEDMVQTKKGTASVLFDDGSLLRLREDTLIVINPPKAQVTAVAAQEVAQRRVRIVVGKLWTFIEPKATAKTVFEVPDGIAAVRGCTGDFDVAYNGSFRLRVLEGTFLPGDFLSGVGWEQGAGIDVSLDRLPRGLRIRNMHGSRGPIGLNFSQGGSFDIFADQGALQFVDADGKTQTLGQGQGGTFRLNGAALRGLPPGGAITIVMKKKGRIPGAQLASLGAFPFGTSQGLPWYSSVGGGQGTGFWANLPTYVQDDRRDPHLSNDRTRRSVFNRELSGGSLRDGGGSSSGPCGPSTEVTGKRRH